MSLHLKISRRGCGSGGWRVVPAVLLPLVVSPVAGVVVGGAAAVPARVRPRLDVHVHHVRLEGVRPDEALAALGAPAARKSRNDNARTMSHETISCPNSCTRP